VEESVRAEILIQRVERKVGAGVVLRHPPFSGTQAAHEALVVGEVDLCPEYSGSALVSVLQLSPSGDAAAIREQVRENCRARFQIEGIGPLGFDSASAMALQKRRPVEIAAEFLKSAGL
jgi:glycine betaine/choline ABC-type transport system substrate-binding protein